MTVSKQTLNKVYACNILSTNYNINQTKRVSCNTGVTNNLCHIHLGRSYNHPIKMHIIFVSRTICLETGYNVAMKSAEERERCNPRNWVCQTVSCIHNITIIDFSQKTISNTGSTILTAAYVGNWCICSVL